MIPLIAAAGALDVAGKVATAAITLAKVISGKETKSGNSSDTAASFADLVALHGGTHVQGGTWRMQSDAGHAHGHNQGHGKSKAIDQIA